MASQTRTRCMLMWEYVFAGVLVTDQIWFLQLKFAYEVRDESQETRSQGSKHGNIEVKVWHGVQVVQ